MEVLAGHVIKYYRALGVASVKVSDLLEVGNLIHIKGHTTNFDQKIESLQIKHQQVTKASAGKVAGLKVNDFVRAHDCVYRVED